MGIKISREVEIGIIKKIGRNDPCPCGSGKKYKKCCQLKEQSSTLNKPHRTSRVMDWLNKKWFGQIFEHEITNLYGTTKKLNQDEVQAVSELCLFEGKYNGKTPLEWFVAEAQLNQEDKAYYTRWLKESFFSIFETKEVFLGKGMKLVDLTDGKEYEVKEKMGTYGLEVGMVLSSRLLPEDGYWSVSGGFFEGWDKQTSQEIKTKIPPQKINQRDYMVITHGKTLPPNPLFNDVEIINDSENFLEHLDNQDGAELTKSLKLINRKTLVKLNSSLVKPNKDGIDEFDFPKIYFLRGLLNVGGLIRTCKGKLVITNRGRNWLDLPTDQKWFELFSAWLFKFNWNYPLHSYYSVSPYQKISLKLFQIMAKMNHEFSLTEWHNQVDIKPKEKVGDVLLEKAIFKILQWFGAIQPLHSEKSKYYLTEIGQTVAKLKIKRL